MNKLLPSDSRTKLGSILLKLECAERVANEMRRTRHYLNDLENFRPVTLEQSRLPSLYASAILPIIDHAPTVYCSAFNSSDRAKGGIGKFDTCDVFGDDSNRRNWHSFLKEYRDKNIAHLTNHSRKTWYLASKDDRRLGSTGVGDVLSNALQPGSVAWGAFRDHLEFTLLWFETATVGLRQKAEIILSKLPESWFDDLPSLAENPIISQSWALRDEILIRILSSKADQSERQ